MTPARDHHRERRFLAEAARGQRAFVDQCESRLEAGEEQFGSSWAWIGIRKHLVELLEEAADLGAWAVLADQALDRSHELSALHRDQIRAALADTAHRGAQAHAAVDRALKSIERLV